MCRAAPEPEPTCKRSSQAYGVEDVMAELELEQEFAVVLRDLSHVICTHVQIWSRSMLYSGQRFSSEESFLFYEILEALRCEIAPLGSEPVFTL